jgi:hypothetical protein
MSKHLNQISPLSTRGKIRLRYKKSLDVYGNVNLTPVKVDELLALAWDAKRNPSAYWVNFLFGDTPPHHHTAIQKSTPALSSISVRHRLLKFLGGRV